MSNQAVITLSEAKRALATVARNHGLTIKQTHTDVRPFLPVRGAA